MVLNDVGPRLNAQGLTRIAEYVGREVFFDTFDDAVTYVQSVSAGFGPHSLAQWRRLTRDVFLQQDDGRWAKHYDTRLAQPLGLKDTQTLQSAELLLWAAYDSIDSPVQVLRGRESDVLTQETAHEMIKRNKHAQLLEFSGVGHAPTLLTDEQIGPIVQFLCGSD